MLINETRAVEALKLAGLPREVLDKAPFVRIGGERMFNEYMLISVINSYNR